MMSDDVFYPHVSLLEVFLGIGNNFSFFPFTKLIFIHLFIKFEAVNVISQKEKEMILFPGN